MSTSDDQRPNSRTPMYVRRKRRGEWIFVVIAGFIVAIVVGGLMFLTNGKHP